MKETNTAKTEQSKMQVITITATDEFGILRTVDAGTIQNAQNITAFMEEGEYTVRIEEEDGGHSTFTGRNVWANVAAAGC